MRRPRRRRRLGRRSSRDGMCWSRPPPGRARPLRRSWPRSMSWSRKGLAGTLPDETRVLYVSPLKALSNDIHRNLEAPLAGHSRRARGARPARCGDTHHGAHGRHAADRAGAHAPHGAAYRRHHARSRCTSCSPRSPGGRCSSTCRTVIVDEIHAIAGNKRGAHLALSLERLRALAGRPLTRIGLSATQKPIEEVARFLIGAGPDSAGERLRHRRCRPRAAPRSGAWSFRPHRSRR